ncbi:MAG: ATP-binding protein, partial [Actinomycetota bacterium]|nr:ATP-binding protein [Actinomycetota bacterium]
MKFVLREGSGPEAHADSTLLRAIGLPGGGIVGLGRTHVFVRPGEVTSPTDLMVPAAALRNSGLDVGSGVEVSRAVLPAAQQLVVTQVPSDGTTLIHGLHGRPMTRGDLVVIEAGYASAEFAAEPISLYIVDVVPRGAAVVGPQTRIVTPDANEAPDPPTRTRAHTPGSSAAPTAPTRTEALLAGLDNELDLLAGWFALLAGPGALADAWGLPDVAGVLVAGPDGCGKAELVRAAAARSGCKVVEIDVTLVFKADSLLDRLSAAVNNASGPTVILVDRLEAVTGDDALNTFRSQSLAILRWFLDSVASKPDLACVLGASTVGELHSSISASPLLPRSISIPPPDLARRRLLFQAAIANLPTDDVDLDQLAAISAGFSGADIVAATVQAGAALALNGGVADTSQLVEAIRAVTPSLGSVPVGEMTSFGFDRVANLDEVKQRLTEAVIWPVTQPERFAQLGIEPPKGVLLYGPPGTGKTFVVKALAHEAGAAFFSIKGAELLDKYVGESERGVRDVFERARAAAPSIMFFDEFDALAPVRGSSSTSVSDSVVAALLTELDGVGERGEVAVIAATNRRDLIDPALLRSGRFETHIELGLPAAAARRKMLDLTDV